jgi:hypothetical protein
MPCDGALPASEVQLNWPSELAISPLDGTLHFIDDNVVLKLTSDKRLTVVAGRPLHCPPSRRPSDLATAATLIEPQSLAFSPNGDLYIAESDSQKINRVRMVTTDGKISLVAGREAECNCLDVGCPCYDPDHFLASNVYFSAISALTVNPNSLLFIADQGNYRLRSLSSGLPPEKADGVFEVPDAEAQETYIFNKFGQHVITKDLMTGSTKFKMSYTQTTSTGELSSVTNAYGSKLTVLRDLKGRVNAFQTATGLKLSLEMSRVGDLESLTSENPPFKALFRYYRSSGLLKSKLDGLNSYLYEYDIHGRLVKAVLPTGEAIGLAFNLTSQGAAIDILNNDLLSEVVLVQDQVMSRRPAIGSNQRHVVSVAADKTLICREADGLGLTIGTIRHPVIALIGDPVMADSFPMAGEQRTFMGTNLISTLGWDYSLASNGRAAMMGIRKTLTVNNEQLLTVFYDKLQRRQLLYSLTNSGGQKDQLLEIRYDSLSRPLKFEAKQFGALTQSYDRFGNLKEWNWGGLIGEAYVYDLSGRLTEVIRSNVTLVQYKYKDAFKTLPEAVITGGGKYNLIHDEQNGGLKQIQTPRGHLHGFNLRPTVGMMRFQYRAPWLKEDDGDYELMYDSNGRLLRSSRGLEHVTYSYDEASNLKKIMVGETESEMLYDSDSGLLESVVTRSGHRFDMRTRLKYHSGLMKEQKMRYSGSSSPDFDSAVFRYQYDGNGRLAVLLTSIGDVHQHTDTFAYNSHTGNIEAMYGLRFNSMGLNKTLITDTDENFFKSVEVDGLGRMSSITVGLQRKEMLSMRLQYNNQGRISRRSVRNHEGRPSEENFSYTTSGGLSKVWGPDNFDFSHDENGNVVKKKGAEGEFVVTYDKGDRVERVASLASRDDFRVEYDPITGCVSRIGASETRRFWHDARGKLVQMVATIAGGVSSRTSYQYDHLGRLAAFIEVVNKGRQPSDKSVIQFFYADVRFAYRVTHVRHPKAGRTQRLVYDDLGHLIGLDTKDQKLYVAADQNGSPVLVFRPDGTIDKSITYSPFGLVLNDSSPAMRLPIGFKGGLVLGHNLVMIDQRVYDAEISQWLNPDWQSLQNSLSDPASLFVYRFNRNDPINDHEAAITYAKVSDLNYWAKLYGYNMDTMMDDTPHQPMTRPKDSLLTNERLLSPDLRLASGLDEAIARARNSLRQMSFVSVPPFKERLILNPKLAASSSGFGTAFLLSTTASSGLSIANVVEGAPGVVQNIFSSLLNGSRLLEDISYLASAQKSAFFFAKKTGTASDVAEAFLSSDMDNVNRLAGQYSVSVRPLLRGKDLVIENDSLELHVLYSDNPSIAAFVENDLKRATEAAMKQAWLREQALVKDGFTGYGDWTSSQQSELLAMRPSTKAAVTNGVRGYEAVEIQPHARYSHLVRDESNYGFVSELLQQRRRKNRHGKSRSKYA